MKTILILNLLGLIFVSIINTLAHAENETLSIEILGSSSYSVIGKSFPIKLLKIKSNLNTESVYAQFIPACKNSCPLLIVSDPYIGINWTGELVDRKWAERPNAVNGFIHADDDGPGYDPKTSIGTIWYSNISPSNIAGVGAPFLLNQISILIVHNRFYAGRNLKNYYEDFIRAANATPLLKEVNTNKIGFYGNSLGGYVALNGYLNSTIKPNAIVLQSPLMDLESQSNYLDTLPILITKNSNLLFEYQKFFDPFARRIFDFTRGTPATAPDAFHDYKIDNFASKIQTPTLLLHDTWDTIIPFENSYKLFNLNRKNIFPIWFMHATDIDFNNFQLGHNQSSEGLNGNNTSPFIQLFFFKNLKITNFAPVLYYNSIDLTAAIKQWHGASQRGQDISWLKDRLVDFCFSPRLLIYDLSPAAIHGTAKSFLVRTLENIWGIKKSEQEICDFIQNQ